MKIRVFKPQYSKPIPDGARIITRKGKKFAQFKDRAGHTRTERLTKKGDKILCEVQEWHIAFEDNKNIKRRLKAYTDKSATEKLAGWIQKLLDNNGALDRDLQKWFYGLSSKIRNRLTDFGIVKNQRLLGHMDKDLKEHLQDFYESLSVKDGSKHVNQVKSILVTIFDSCGFLTPNDIDGHALYRYLGNRLHEGEISQRTFNCYLKFAKHFCKWMKKEDRIINNLLEHLEPVPETEPKRKRRALTNKELVRLLETTRKAKERYGMTGEERWMLYVLACQTGMRASDLRRLKVGDFDFDSLGVTIRASCSKNKKKKSLPLKPTTAAILRDYFRGKLPNVKAFGGTYKQLTIETAKMLREDLKAAKIPYIDDQGHVFDFHALRKEAGTLLKQAGVNMKDAQSILRHSDPRLTANIYTETFADEERQAVSKLPDFAAPKRKKAGA